MSEAILIAMIGAIAAILAAIIGAVATLAAARIKEKQHPNQTNKILIKHILITMSISGFIGLVLGIFLATSIFSSPTNKPTSAPLHTPRPTLSECQTCSWWTRIATHTKEWNKSGTKIGRAAEPSECVEEIGDDGSRIMYRINADGSATFLPSGAILSGVFVDAQVPPEHWKTSDGRRLIRIRRGTSCSNP